MTSRGDVHVLTVRNLSASGVFLEGDPLHLPDLKPGADLDLVLSCSDPVRPDDIVNIRFQAQIARVDFGDPPARPAGFGATIKPVDDVAAERLQSLLEALRGAAAPLP